MVTVRNLKYGSSLQHGGRNYSYGFVNGRVAARINHLLLISIKRPNNLPDLTTNIALVRQFKPAEEHIQSAATPVPWHTWSIYYHYASQMIPDYICQGYRPWYLALVS